MATLGARPTDSLRRRSTVALPSGESAWQAATSAKAVAIASWIGLRKGADGSNHLTVSNAIGRALRISLKAQSETNKVINVLWTIAITLLVPWLLGFSFHVAGGFIHLLLVIAVVVIIFRLVTRRAP